MKCGLCEILEEKREIVYEDEDIAIAAKTRASVAGQLSVFPKQHFTILEMVPSDLLEKCAIVANKMGMVVFEALGVQGTNLLIANGLGAGQAVPHFGLEVLPRKENDGLQLQWPLQPAEESDLEVTAELLKEELSRLKEVPEEKKETPVPEKEKKSGDNYLLKSLKRIP